MTNPADSRLCRLPDVGGAQQLARAQPNAATRRAQGKSNRIRLTAATNCAHVGSFTVTFGVEC